MKKILSAVLAALMLCTMFAACAKNGDSSSAKVTVTVEADGVKIIENVEVTVKGVDGAAPVAWDAILDALDSEDVKYTMKELGIAGTFFDEIGGYGTEDGKYAWKLFINDAKDEAPGKLNAITLAEGDKLVLSRTEYVSTKNVTTEETELGTETTSKKKPTRGTKPADTTAPVVESNVVAETTAE